jgi:outer membrane murein-binding lipoprotein Lpp
MNFNLNTLCPLAALLIASVWLLAGCSGEPGNADIERALAVQAAQGTARMEQLSKGSSQAFMPAVHAARKLGCKPDTAAAFVCDVELDLTPPRGVRTRTYASLRFVQGSDGWAFAR